MIIDFSIIPSYKCNLSCWFCMYNASPTNNNTLNYELTKEFVETIDWKIINSVGFYGGEISISMPLYQNFINLIPKNKSRFTISNGSWSKDLDMCLKFIDFISDNRIRVKISCTPEHKKYQNVTLLEKLQKASNGNIFIKENDDTKGKLLSMGRLEHLPINCTEKCKTMSLPVIKGEPSAYRIALEPTGDIILQSCDGRYPVIGNYHQTFNEIIISLLKFTPITCNTRKIK